MLLIKIFTKGIIDIDRRDVITSVFFAFLIRTLGFIFSFILILAIAKYFGSEAVGIFAITISILQIGSTIGKLGTDTFFLREIAKRKYKILITTLYRNIIGIAFFSSVIVAFILFSTSNFVSIALFDNLKLESAIKLISFIIPFFSLLYIHTQGLRGLKHIKEFVFFQFFFPFFLATILLLFFSYNLSILYFLKNNKDIIPIFVFSISIVISLILATIYFHYRLIKYNDVPKYTKKQMNIKSIVIVSLPILFANLVNILMNWTDTLILGIFKSESEVGIYNTVSRIYMALGIFLFAVNSIAAPKFAEYYGKGNLEKLKNVVMYTTKLSFYLSLPFILIILLFGKNLLAIFGEEFISGYIPLLILLLGQIINVSSGSVSIFLQMTDFEKFHRNIMLLSLVLNIFLNFFLIPSYGMIGAAISTTLTVCFWNFIFTFKIKKFLGIWSNYFLFWKN